MASIQPMTIKVKVKISIKGIIATFMLWAAEQRIIGNYRRGIITLDEAREKLGYYPASEVFGRPQGPLYLTPKRRTMAQEKFYREQIYKRRQIMQQMIFKYYAQQGD